MFISSFNPKTFYKATAISISTLIGISSFSPICAARPDADTQITGTVDQSSGEIARGSESIKDDPFANLDSSDKILPLEDGGFLIGNGEVEIFSIDDLENPIETINLDDDANTVTISEARSIFNERESETGLPSPQQDIIVPSSKNIMGLKLGQEYVSQKFKGSGWVFAGWWFVAMEPDKYGSYLRWSTHVDAGRVTDLYHFHLLDAAGAAIYPEQYYWINFGISVPQTYCTYNPLNGTYYTVGNIDA